MILQALDGCYHRLASRDDPPVPPYGYSDQPVSYALVLGSDGPVRDVVSIGSQGQRRFEPARIPVPGPVIRTSGVASNFLWDKSAYLLGVKRDQDDKANVVETLREHAAFRKLHEELLAENDDEGLRAVLAFLAGWTPSRFGTVFQGREVLDANLVFRLDGELRFVHDHPAAREIWARHVASKSGADGLCLVTGDAAPLARLHPPIKGVRGAQSSGGSIVSFNRDAFTSFGKDQGLNAPVSEHAAFAYTTALNYLLRPSEHNRQRLQIGDATTVFWAEARSREEEAAAEAAEDLFGLLAAPPSEERLETQEAARRRSVLEKVAGGRPLKDIDPNLDPRTRFFILGLAPNAARLSVRFWHVDELGSLAERFCKHWQDLAIEPRPWKAAPATWQLLYEAAAQRKAENIPPNLAGELMRSILTGARYPATLFASIVMRCRRPQPEWHARGDPQGLLGACGP